MIFTETKLQGAYVIDLDRKEDERGFFARAFCQQEFAAHGLKPVIAQANVAFNYTQGTLRGMHFQYPPAAETKLVRCTRGAILDIIVDLRPESAAQVELVHVGVVGERIEGDLVVQAFTKELDRATHRAPESHFASRMVENAAIASVIATSSASLPAPACTASCRRWKARPRASPAARCVWMQSLSLASSTARGGKATI